MAKNELQQGNDEMFFSGQRNLNQVDALAVVQKYTAKRLYDGKMITGYGYCYNGKTYVTESDAPPHLVNWHEVDGTTVQICLPC